MVVPIVMLIVLENGSVHISELQDTLAQVGVHIDDVQLQHVLNKTDSAENALDYDDMNKILNRINIKPKAIQQNMSLQLGVVGSELDTPVSRVKQYYDQNNATALVDYPDEEPISHYEQQPSTVASMIPQQHQQQSVYEQHLDVHNSTQQQSPFDRISNLATTPGRSTTPKRTKPEGPSLLQTMCFGQEESASTGTLQKTIAAKVLAKSSSLKDVFRSIDTDRDGALSIDDVDRGLKTLGIPLLPTQVESVMQEMTDKNHVDFQSFANYISKIPNNSKTKMAPQMVPLSQDSLLSGMQHKMTQRSGQMRVLFRLMDENRDGQVTHEEFEKGLQNVGIVLPQEELNHVLATCDAENKGHFNYQEFTRVFNPPPEAIKTFPKRHVADNDEQNICRLKNEVIDAAGGVHRVQRAIKNLEMLKGKTLNYKSFTNAVRSFGKLPEWAVEKAAKIAELSPGNYNYDKFLNSLELQVQSPAYVQPAQMDDSLSRTSPMRATRYSASPRLSRSPITHQEMRSESPMEMVTIYI